MYTGKKIGILTSGGDAQGMNAATRAVVRTALSLGAQAYAITEGWAGAVLGGEGIHQMGWSDVSSIINKGGTVIGTARCDEFRERSGMRKAAKHLVQLGIDRLVAIGGDGSLSGAEEFRQEWPSLLQELVDSGEISAELAQAHPALLVVGIVGSIDNDLVGSDMTIGADSALHRIVDAIDDIAATAASHQRIFVVEVMGRNCGYLPLMAGIAGGCDYVMIPEMPPGEGWEDDMCAKLQAGRQQGRRESIVLVAEGATDQQGNRIHTQDVADAIEARLGQKPRVTILGHVQRGGHPSAYDRWMSTLLGYSAAHEVLSANIEDEARIMAVRQNRIATLPLTQAVQNTRSVRQLLKESRFDEAVATRGTSFEKMLKISEVLSTPPTMESATVENKNKRIAIIHAGGLAPGMNTAARAAVRMGLHLGYEVLGVQGSFEGLIAGSVKPLAWEDVEGWGFSGGAEIGTRRPIPSVEQFYSLGRSIENNRIDGMIVVGGYNAYLAVQKMFNERDRYPAFNIPMLLVPASIDNNLPGSELSIGCDTALNNAVWALDRMKESAEASQRCFVAETMGRSCGYLALMSGIATGAELVYLDEEEIPLDRIAKDAQMMRASFATGRRLFLVVRNEKAGGRYDMPFMATVFEQESQGAFDVRTNAVGHLQQGGDPSPFDRLLATRLMYEAMQAMDEHLQQGTNDVGYLGMAEGHITFHSIERMDREVDKNKRRPLNQWWLDLRRVIPVVSVNSGPAPSEKLPLLAITD